MSANLKGCKYLIDFIVNKRVSARQLKNVIDQLTGDQTRCIREILINILAGNLTLPRAFLVKFGRHKNILRKLSKTKRKKDFGTHFKLLKQIIGAVYIQLKPIIQP